MKRFLAQTFKIGLALLLSLTIWETILRLTIVTPIPYAHNPRLGWLPAPNSRGMEAYEGRGLLRFNELGFRDAPLTSPASTETRILCLGDSYTLGAQMSVEQTYPRRLEKLLRERGIGGAHVINAGRAGTTLSFSVGLAQQYRQIFQPDWTIIQVRDGWGENFNREQEVHFVEEKGNYKTQVEWHWDTMSPRMKQLIRWHIRDIALFQYGARHLNELLKGSSGIQESQSSQKSANSAASTKPFAHNEVYQRDLRAIGWAVSQLKSQYPRLILLHMPYALPDSSGLMPPQPEEQELVAQCRRQNVPLITMREAYQQDFQISRQAPIGFANTLPWSGHPNGRAHALSAQSLADYLTPLLKSETSAQATKVQKH